MAVLSDSISLSSNDRFGCPEALAFAVGSRTHSVNAAAAHITIFTVAPLSLLGRRAEVLLPPPVGARPHTTNAEMIAKSKTHRISQPLLPLDEIITAERPAAQAIAAM